jgi:hypothetical protein
MFNLFCRKLGCCGIIDRGIVTGTWGVVNDKADVELFEFDCVIAAVLVTLGRKLARGR